MLKNFPKLNIISIDITNFRKISYCNNCFPHTTIWNNITSGVVIVLIEYLYNYRDVTGCYYSDKTLTYLSLVRVIPICFMSPISHHLHRYHYRDTTTLKNSLLNLLSMDSCGSLHIGTRPSGRYNCK